MSRKNLLASALLCASLVSLVSLVSLFAISTAQAATAAEGKTRAQVLEELKQAQADGSYYCNDSDRQLECNALAEKRQLALKKAPQLGHWLSQSGLLEIEIAACGQSLCGTVIKELGQSTNSTSALGLQVLSGLKPVSSQQWQGRIYNRGNGLTYECLMSLASPTELHILAYQDTPANGKEQIWNRVD